ncbi:hypothetical protein BLNAU_889 [Blattamonas nauphoetae]|uniref:Ubiquitin-like domain-containing protein n=1 Tax=Blattamonas nauphoetae TaxID=2049346 RepID=A0ABQ9YKS5_9EUKA|nr:hypothetical protein BLNAU_889 [Blattamonas nauphoetae]
MESQDVLIDITNCHTRNGIKVTLSLEDRISTLKNAAAKKFGVKTPSSCLLVKRGKALDETLLIQESALKESSTCVFYNLNEKPESSDQPDATSSPHDAPVPEDDDDNQSGETASIVGFRI